MAAKKILCIIGTRPEAIKMAPVILELRRHPETFETTIMTTAQHREMLDQMLRVFSIVPDTDLDLMRRGQTITEVTCRVLDSLARYFETHRPDVVLAQGDTTTVMASATACFYADVAFGHVEAGLRTRNLRQPFPEEFNRRVAGIAAAYHLAPTPHAAANLREEAVDPASIFVTGNTVIDALQHILEQTDPPALPVPDGARYVLMTCHRREIFGEKIREVFTTVREYAKARSEVYFWYPVHPNPKVYEVAHELLAGLDNVLLTDPLDYITFLHAMNRCTLLLSDSGGVQEEAPSLGKPVLVLRDKTERPEGVEAGVCRLVGPHRDRITEALDELLDDETAYAEMTRAKNPYGDGRASERIAGILQGLDVEPWPC